MYGMRDGQTRHHASTVVLVRLTKRKKPLGDNSALLYSGGAWRLRVLLAFLKKGKKCIKYLFLFYFLIRRFWDVTGHGF